MWTIIGDRSDEDEFYIPLAPGHRSRGILQRLVDGPTWEERMRIEKQMAKDEAKRLAEIERLRERHEELLHLHALAPLKALLEQHAPVGISDVGRTYLECHGCPTYYDYDPFGDGGEQHHSWPCPTWQTISDATP